MNEKSKSAVRPNVVYTALFSYIVMVGYILGFVDNITDEIMTVFVVSTVLATCAISYWFGSRNNADKLANNSTSCNCK